MIRFRCRNGHDMEAPAELAGEQVQCPDCGLLVDVPRLDELPSLSEDGTFNLTDDTYAGDAPIDLAEAGAPHFADRADQSDRRGTLAEFLAAGVGADDGVPLTGERKSAKRPRYDPVTGELIEAIDVKADPRPEPVAAIPVADVAPTLEYDRGVAPNATERLSLLAVYVRLLAPGNLIVWVIVAVVALLNVLMLGTPVGLLYMFLLFPLVLLLLGGQLPCVVEETGYFDADELPRPLRNASLTEDAVYPTFKLGLAVVWAWLPLWVVWFAWPAAPPLVWVGLLAAGLLLFPAALLTAVLGGAYNNLLPHRVLPLMTLCGVRYWVAALTGGLGVVALLLWLGLSASLTATMHQVLLRPVGAAGVRQTLFALPTWVESAGAVTLVFVASYLLHAFGWQLGLLYRRYHERFPWVLQKFEKSDRTDVTSQLRQMREEQRKQRAEAARRRIADRMNHQAV